MSFVNKGKYGNPDETIMTQEDMEKAEKEELEEGTDYSILTVATQYISYHKHKTTLL